MAGMGMKNAEVIIVGGGLGGLTAAALLAKKGREVLLIEKKTYPFHRVCGEYVSNEVREFLQKENLYPYELEPAAVNRFRLTSSRGKVAEMKLDLGGFGVSRYGFDEFLYRKALSLGAKFMLQQQAEQVEYLPEENLFRLELNTGERLTADHVVGAFGKRSKIDKTLSRSFMTKRTPYIGVKYHIKGDFEADTIAIHHFDGGYCGLNPIENKIFNLCYLGNKQQLKEQGGIRKMEQEVLYKNVHLKKLFENAAFLWDKPEVINEINFEPKLPVENHLLMIGDAAGMIAPLCGNGMAIAIHTGKLAAEAILMNHSRQSIENQYQNSWNRYFKKRLAMGRFVQGIFDVPAMAELSTGLIQRSPFLGRQLMKRTHGKIF